VTPAERDSRLVLQGVLLTFAALLTMAGVGAMMTIARGGPVGPWTLGLLIASLVATAAGALRWVIPEQRRTLRRHLLALGALLVLAAAAALLVWGLQ